MCSVTKASVYAVGARASDTRQVQDKCQVHALKTSGNHEEIQDRIRRSCLLLVAGKLSHRKPQKSTDMGQTLALPNISRSFFLSDHLLSHLHVRGFNCLIIQQSPVQIFYQCLYTTQNNGTQSNQFFQRQKTGFSLPLPLMASDTLEMSFFHPSHTLFRAQRMCKVEQNF